MTSVIRNYDGPAPPDGDGPHRYLYITAALDIAVPVPIPQGADRGSAGRPRRSHIIAETSLIGTYAGRRPSPARSSSTP